MSVSGDLEVLLEKKKYLCDKRPCGGGVAHGFSRGREAKRGDRKVNWREKYIVKVRPEKKIKLIPKTGDFGSVLCVQVLVRGV